MAAARRARLFERLPLLLACPVACIWAGGDHIPLCPLCVFLLPAAKVTWAIHREAPPFVDQGVEQQILTTGIKVRLLLAWSFVCKLCCATWQQAAACW